MYLLIIVSALSASTFTLGKALLSYAPPIFLIGTRMFCAGFLFFIYRLVRYRSIISIRRNDWALFIQMAIISFCSSFIFEFCALQYLTSTKTAFLYNLSPFIAAFFSYIHFHEHMTVKKFLGLIIGLVGFLPILMATAPHEGNTLLFISWPELGMFIAVLCYTYGWILMRTLVKKRRYDSLTVNTVGMLIGGFVALVLSYILEHREWVYTNGIRPIAWLPITNISLPSFLLLIIPLIVGGTMICYSLYGHFLKRYTATFVTLTDFMGPLFAALYGRAFLGETVSWHFFASTIIVFFGVYLFYQEELRQGYFEHA